jgi:hypothetical protein
MPIFLNIVSEYSNAQGHIAGIPYDKDSFIAKWVVEPYGGPHDFLNDKLSNAYDTVNGSTRMSRWAFDGTELTGESLAFVPRAAGTLNPEYGAFQNVMNYVNLLPATPLATATIINQLPPGTLQVIENARNAAKASRENAP